MLVATQFIPPGDSSKLKEAILKLANDKTLFKELCINARKKAELFSPEAAVKRFVELCKECINKKKMDISVKK